MDITGAVPASSTFSTVRAIGSSLNVNKQGQLEKRTDSFAGGSFPER